MHPLSCTARIDVAPDHRFQRKLTLLAGARLVDRMAVVDELGRWMEVRAKTLATQSQGGIHGGLAVRLRHPAHQQPSLAKVELESLVTIGAPADGGHLRFVSVGVRFEQIFRGKC